MIYVQNDEAAYVWWLDANPMGFVANLHVPSKGKAKLHTARCGHLYPPESGKAHTGATQKACSCDRDEVQQWVSENGFEIVLCTSCNP
jgi:hypothetical protein